MNYVPNTTSQQEQLLARIGVKDIEELFQDVPESVRLHRPLSRTRSSSPVLCY